MNAITHTETQSIATVLETAAPAQNLLLVPLSQLRPSRRNVRKTAGQSIDALAASIARVGLLQNLTVILAGDGEHYECPGRWP
jgi:ParB family chromosome partitioning protein